ncbi:integrase/transposase [Pilimelia anulata]|uniref:Integrase/transposase n=1 Tax=Pilimelia anulata TaxID=53371 RepID=A0A8J3B2C9_9ACTN|nr:hypothetical protein [Pilimelia anulata]GGJ75173.1 integrase/transposase [Pilimelia anulata]
MSGDAARAEVAVGVRLWHDGVRFTVVEIAAGRVVLLAEDGTGRQVDLGWLMSQPATRFEGSVDADGAAGARVMTASGIVLGSLGEEQTVGLNDLAAHMREVLTGFRHGCVELACEGEPRPAYLPKLPLLARYEAKAAELGVGVSTLRRWLAEFRVAGPVGLVAAGTGTGGRPLGVADPRWVQACRDVLGEHVEASRPTRAWIMNLVEQRLEQEHGVGAVPVPARSSAYAHLAELTRGSNAFTGSTKGKRSIAARPKGVYGRLRATRPGEYLLLDTTRLDVFAMESLTCRWVQVELTAAMDLYTRCITGLRLTPVSTKAADVAGVLYESLRPDHGGQAGGVRLPYHGVPETVLVDAAKVTDAHGRRILPSVAAEAIVYDHGAVYLSNQVRSACAKLGVSLQPARPATPTDKSPLERWFRSLGEGLLVALPGYKGPDIHSRGRDVEAQAFYFIDELEAIVREWITDVYHLRAHSGLRVPQIPGLRLSPLDMYSHGVARAGHISVPCRLDLVYDFLQVRWTRLQHYGVDIDRMRYDGPVLVKYRNTTSPFTGAHAGRWPFAVDPHDVRRVFFQDPADGVWHTLWWEHAAGLRMPFSAEAAAYAKSLAVRRDGFVDVSRAVRQLLARWAADGPADKVERRMALRHAQPDLHLIDPVDSAPISGDLTDALTVEGSTPKAVVVPAPRRPADEHRDDSADNPTAVEPTQFYADVMDSL